VAVTPRCPGCRRELDRIDHYGIEHLILDGATYRPMNATEGLASRVDLRCGYCQTPVPRTSRAFFYQRWEQVQAATAGYTAESRERWRAEIAEAKRTMTREEFAQWLNRRMNSAG
jgi:hypothetical protein